LSLFSSISKAFRSLFGGSKSAPAALDDGGYVQASWRRAPPDAAGDDLLHLYHNSWPFRQVVSKIAQTFAAQRLVVRKDGEEVTDHPLCDLLHAPNDEFAGPTVRALEQIWLSILDESFAIVMPRDDGGFDYLPIPPSCMTREGSGTWIVQFSGTTQWKIGPDSPWKVVWLRHPSPAAPFDRPIGKGHAIADEVQIHEYSSKHLKAFFYNAARPDVLMIIPGLDDKQRKRFQQEWSSRYSGAINAHQVAVLSPAGPHGDVQVLPLGSSFKDSQMMELRAEEIKAVAQFYGVPPEIVGRIENSNRATIHSALDIMADFIVDPALEFYCMELNRQLVPLFEEEGLEVGYVSSKPKDREFQLKVMEAAPWSFTVNEWRELGGQPKRADGDRYVIDPNRQVFVEAAEVVDLTSQARLLDDSAPPPLPANTKIKLIRTERSQEAA